MANRNVESARNRQEIILANRKRRSERRQARDDAANASYITAQNQRRANKQQFRSDVAAGVVENTVENRRNYMRRMPDHVTGAMAAGETVRQYQDTQQQYLTNNSQRQLMADQGYAVKRSADGDYLTGSGNYLKGTAAVDANNVERERITEGGRQFDDTLNENKRRYNNAGPLDNYPLIKNPDGTHDFFHDRGYNLGPGVYVGPRGDIGVQDLPGPAKPMVVKPGESVYSGGDQPAYTAPAAQTDAERFDTYVREMYLQAHPDVVEFDDDGNVVNNEEVERKFQKWYRKNYGE